MPIYEYLCNVCGNKLEVFQKIQEPKLDICPSCNNHSLAKLISVSSFQLKGTGWYATDFKNNNTVNKTVDKQDTNNNGS